MTKSVEIKVVSRREPSEICAALTWKKIESNSYKKLSILFFILAIPIDAQSSAKTPGLMNETNGEKGHCFHSVPFFLTLVTSSA